MLLAWRHYSSSSQSSKASSIARSDEHGFGLKIWQCLQVTTGGGPSYLESIEGREERELGKRRDEVDEKTTGGCKWCGC